MSRTLSGNLTGAAARTEKMDAAIERRTPRKSDYGKCTGCGESIPNPWYNKSGLCADCRKAQADNATLRARFEGLVAQLNDAQNLEPWEIAEIDAELAEVQNALQRDGETVSDEARQEATIIPENKALGFGVKVVIYKNAHNSKPWDLEADRTRNSKFIPSSPKNM